MDTDDKYKTLLKVEKKFYLLNKKLLSLGISLSELNTACFVNQKSKYSNLLRYPFIIFITIFICLLLSFYTDQSIVNAGLKYFLTTRCLIPNNYLIWESTRPISDCKFCKSITSPLILYNASRAEFSKYAYSSRPIIVKSAVKHWPAMEVFTFDFFKKLYNETEGALESTDEDCQFLHFRSNFINARDLFSMSEERAKNFPGEKPWYIGLGNCHPDILKTTRKYYSIPHFIPEDAEVPAHEYIFFGYNDGATMHLDYIPRLMWQAQLSGNKTWYLIPTPECESSCQPVTFYVEAGDAVLLDTRLWYHNTSSEPGKFSLTLQSEYG